MIQLTELWPTKHPTFPRICGNFKSDPKKVTPPKTNMELENRPS